MNRRMPSPGQPITVLTIGMDAKKQAIFRMAFRMYTVQHYRLLEDAQGASPDIAIIDMDSVGAQSLWDGFRAKFPDMPAVITTVTPAADAPAPVLAKPVRMDALFPLLRATLTAPKAPARPAPAAASTLAPSVTGHSPPARQAEGSSRPSAPVQMAPRAAAPVAAAPERISATPAVTPEAGNAPAPVTSKPVQHLFPDTVERFSPRHGLFHHLRDIRAKRSPSMLSLDGVDYVMALPAQDNAILLGDPGLLREACESGTSQVNVRPLTPRDIPPRAASQSLTSLLWQVSLWTSRGRLMEGMLPDMTLHLRHWPNLTRLAPVPEAMRIAAFWVRFPVTPRLAVKMLNVAPRHVFDFLAATYAIGILEMPDRGGEPVVAPSVVRPPPTAEQKARGGFLSRLLRKVVGM